MLSDSHKHTCKRPPSPKCSTSRMLSDCMKAVDRQRKFPWGLDISKQCHASWWIWVLSVYKWLFGSVSDLDTITHQATQRKETGNHYSHFAIIRRLDLSWVSSWRTLKNRIVSQSRALQCKRSYSCKSVLRPGNSKKASKQKLKCQKWMWSTWIWFLVFLC